MKPKLIRMLKRFEKKRRKTTHRPRMTLYVDGKKTGEVRAFSIIESPFYSRTFGLL